MGCNCKRAYKFLDENDEDGKSVLGSVARFLYKTFVFVLVVVVMAVASPFVAIYGLWQMFFGKGGIVIPKFVMEKVKLKEG